MGIRPSEYPPNAMKVVFQPLSGKTVKYRVWTNDGAFYWAANGHSGKELTLELAMRAAREYILYGVNGLAGHGEYRGVLNAS